MFGLVALGLFVGVPFGGVICLFLYLDYVSRNLDPSKRDAERDFEELYW